MQQETETPTLLPCGGVDENGYYVVCDSSDREDDYPSEILETWHMLLIFAGVIFLAGLFTAAIMYCNRAAEQKKRDKVFGK